MTISIKTNSLFHVLQVLTISLLGACGGGGGSDNKLANSSDAGTSSSAVAQDMTPNTFNFTASTNAATSAAVTSPTVTISGINTSTPVSISGGEYSINGGAFTSAAGTITNGQTLTVRITASDKTNTPKEATITVGGVSAKFTVTTAADVTPDAFTFSPKNEAAVNTEYTSDSITVKGIDIAVPVSITGGTYSINGGAYTASVGTVSADQTITVKATSGSDTEITQNAVLTVGGVTGTFAVTTIADTTPPVAEFKFPTPYTMSEASEVKVRGTATDDHAITSVKLVVRSFNLASPEVTVETKEVIAEPKSEANGVKDFSSWTATIPLTATAENEIKVVATDDRNNTTLVSNANQITVRQANAKSAFPNEVNQFDEATYTASDSANNRNRLLVADRGKIWAVDFATGERTLFVDHHVLCSSVLYGLLIDDQSDKLYGVCDNTLYEFDLNDGSLIDTYIESQLTSNLIFGLALDRNNGRNRIVMVEDAYEHSAPGGVVLGFSLDSKQFSLISNANISPLIKGARNILVAGDKYLVTTGGQHADGNTHSIISVDALSGERSLVSDNSVGNGELFSGELPDGNWPAVRGIVLDNRSLYISESLSNRLISLNLDTGERGLFKNLSYHNENSVGLFVDDLDLDSARELLLTTDSTRDAIIIVDLKSREKLILSKSKNNF